MIRALISGFLGFLLLPVCGATDGYTHEQEAQQRDCAAMGQNYAPCQPPAPPPKPLLSCSPDGSIIISSAMQGLFADPKLGILAWSYAVKACSAQAGVKP